MARFLICISILFTFLGKASFGQSLDWVLSVGSSSDDGNYDLVTDDSSNLYVTGWFSQTVDLDPGSGVSLFSSAGNRDAYVTKFDSLGIWQWSRTFGASDQDEGSVITHDLDGNVIVAGRFTGIVDFDPGVNSYNLTSNGDRDVFIVKYSSNGTLLWAKSFGGSGYDDAERIRVDRLGNWIFRSN